MKEKVLKNKTIFIVAAAIVLAAIGFAAGMMVRSCLLYTSKIYLVRTLPDTLLCPRAAGIRRFRSKGH